MVVNECSATSQVKHFVYRNTWRIVAAVILGILAFAAYAYISLPGRIKVAPVSIVVNSSSSLPAEVQALEAQTAPYLFDRDTTSAHVAYADQSIDTFLEKQSEIQVVKVYGPAPYELTVQAQQGSTWSTIAGLDKIKLASQPAGWNSFPATQAVTTGALRFVLSLPPGNGGGGGKGNSTKSTTTAGGIPEIEIWATGEHPLLNGAALLAAIPAATPAGTSNQTSISATSQPAPAQARIYLATPDKAVVGKDGQTFRFSLDRPANRFKRAWLSYEAYGLSHWVSPVRRINGLTVQGGAFTFSGADWTPVSEPIRPDWLTSGSNSVDFTLPANVAGNYSVRNVRVIAELDDGNNFITHASTTLGGIETDAAALVDGDLATGWSPYANPRGKAGDPLLTLYFDKPTQLDTLSLNLANALSGTFSLDVLVGGQWQNAGLQTLNGTKLSAGWNSLGGFAPVAADALRITFQNGTGSPGVIREIAATGSGTGTAFVPAINVAYPDAGQFYGRQAYIRGYLSVPDNGSGPAAVAIAGKSIATPDGSFGLVVSKEDAGYASQTDTEPWQVEIDALYPNGQKLTQIVKLTQANDASKAHGSLPNTVNPGFAELLANGDASLDIDADALDKPLDIKITPLTDKDLPALDPGMTNVTPSPHKGYRFTPHGAHFKKDIKVTIPFDPALIPAGLKTNDVKTFYFDTERGHWVELARFRIDTNKHKVTSLTNHFTDMINATLTVPDHPETTSFNATQMKDIKAADPGSQINLIEPPKANNMGDARLSYPIEIPQGRQGMQPQLAISYNSSGGNGWLGVGWDMSVPSITVDTRWGVPRYDTAKESETYMLNGEMLTPVAHRGELVDRTVDKIFHTRIEGAFRKIIRHGDAPTNYWWEVTDKNGIKNFYGGDGSKQDAGAILGGGQGVFRWSLTKTIDPHGNSVSYSYAKVEDVGVAGGTVPGYQLYIHSIAYTGDANGDGPYTVNFKRDRELKEARRPDVMIDARGGFKQVTADLLRKIDVVYNKNLVRSYELVYKAGAFNKTLLDHVVQYGSDGNTEFNRHVFAYYDDARNEDGSYKGFAPADTWAAGSDSVSTLSLFGNGSVSVLGGNTGQGVGGSLYIGAGEGPAVMTKLDTIGFKIGYNQSQSETLLVMTDMNGDGLPDKVFKKDGRFYYRPNLSGPHGSAGFGDKVYLPTLPALGSDNVTTTSVGAESYYGLPAMLDVADSYSQTDTYISDVNGDGIPDLVAGGQVLFGYIGTDGVPAFSPNSADTPVTVNAGTLDANGMLPDPAAIEAKRAATFPLLDTVRKWVAPYDGIVSINAPVQLIRDTSSVRDKYTKADGVKVAIQKEGAELWSASIPATNYAVVTPSGVNSVQVQKGDRLYFRLQSVANGAYDQVAWNPEINYLNVDNSRLDSNGLPVYRYRAAQDFTLAGRNTTVMAPLTGSLHLGGILNKTGVTSDDVKLVVYQNGIAVYSLPLTGSQVGSYPIAQDLQVTQQDKLQWKLETDSPIDATQLQLLPQAWYTAAQGVDDIKDEKGNYVVQLNPSYTMDLYPVNTLDAPQEPYIVKSTDLDPDGTLQVNFAITSSDLSSGENKQVAFTIKRAGLLLAKKLSSFVQLGSFLPSAGGSLQVKVAVGDVLYFDYSSRDITDITAIGNNQTRVGQPPSADEPAHLAPSAIHIAAEENLYPQAYRGWSVFGYNGNSPRDRLPIDQSLLVLSNSAKAEDVRAYPFAAGAINAAYPTNPAAPAVWGWIGPDASAWVSASQTSASRLGLKDITLPRGAQFAGSSAPPRMSYSNSLSASLGVGATHGTSESRVEFQDLNGDRFPDVIGNNGVQYTSMTGGLTGSMGGGISGARNSSNTSVNADSSGVGSIAAAIANARGDVNTNGSRGAPGTSNGSIEPTFGVSGGYGSSNTESDLIDVNGDGLPDRVFKNGNVELNLGYSFSPPEPWSGGDINKGETLNGGLNLGFSMGYASISGGLSLNLGDSHTNESYVDINGDGLPDKITGNGPFNVRLNTGTGFAPAINWPGGLGGIGRDKNISLGAGGSFTYGFTILLARVVFTPALNMTQTVGRPELAFRDMDGDGFVDQAYSIQDNSLSVASNQIGRTNLLKEIKRPLGASINLEYERTGNTYTMPQSRWVMSKVAVNDGFAGDGVDTHLTTYRYESGNYNRLERDFYGFAKVIEEQRDITDNSVYRTATSTYFNGNYYGKGLELSALTSDGNGNKFIESINTYRLRDMAAPDSDVAVDDPVVGASTTATLFPMLTRTERNFYEGGQGSKTTYTSQEYDNYGNITRFFDAGDTGSADDVEALINYSIACKDTSYIIGKPTTIDVIGAGQLMRSRVGTIDCGSGNLTQLTQKLENGTAATTDLVYDPNGNLNTLTGPANLKGQRYSLKYAYDSAVATYVASVTDSFGYTSSASYDYRYGKPLSSTDLNGNIISYAYDNVGRTVSVKGPYEQTGNNLTLSFAYHPEAAVPYATTQHLNLDAAGNVQSPIETVLFTDGIKRVLQTKKSAAVNGVPMMTVSGRVLFDAMGRTVKQYYPVAEPLGQDGTFNPSFDSIAPTTTDYDVLDRSTKTTLPDSTSTSIQYGFGTDRNGATQFKTTVTDANQKSKESYRDVRELITSVKEFNNGKGLWTSYQYDPLKQITQVTDAKGNLTKAEYDTLGRRVALANPDTGKTVTVYDTASNVIQKITANLAASGKAVTYDYDFNRLTAIHYPDNHGNDVSYEYGAADLHNSLNQIGRITKVTDASGSEERAYGKLGETVKETRTIASHTQGNSANSPEVYTTQYQYDTFGRILQLTLPDTETITYTYDAGGNLNSFAGDKKAQGSGDSHTQYLQSLLYDKFEQRTYLKLGNNVETTYSYRPDNRRLKNLTSHGTVAGKFQNLNYRYDNVGNILGLKNDTAIPAPNSFGGPTSQSYGYDDLYRLTTASGTFQSAPDKTRSYTLNMGYDDIHNIVAKTQTDTLSNTAGNALPQKATSYDWAYAYGASQPHAPSHIGNHTYSYDLNGNQTGWTDDKNGTRRIILWDEDNRIAEIDDNGERSHYTYDDKGERIIKQSRQGETVYVNQYYVVRNRSIVSKHLFAGSTRLVTRLLMGTAPGNSFRGAGSNGQAGQGGSTVSGQSNTNSLARNAGEGNAYGLDKQNPGQGDEHRNDHAQSADTHGKSGKQDNGNAGNHGNAVNSGTENATHLPGNSEAGLENALANGKGNKYGIYKHLEREGDTVEAGGDIVPIGSNSGSGTTPAPSNTQSDFTYYYHPDHLGSTGYVTDANGKLYEHIEYFPFGETWVQEHSNTLRTPYLFTGKEFDQETGLYYFGARYYDPRTSVWQSADPILSKYLPKGGNGNGIYDPFVLAMYSYGHLGPLVFKDPDGRDNVAVVVGVRKSTTTDLGNSNGSYNIQQYKVFHVPSWVPNFAKPTVGKLFGKEEGSFELTWAARSHHRGNRGTVLGDSSKMAEVSLGGGNHPIHVTDIGKSKEDTLTQKIGSKTITREYVRMHWGGPSGSEGCGTMCDLHTGMSKSRTESILKENMGLNNSSEKHYVVLPKND